MQARQRRGDYRRLSDRLFEQMYEATEAVPARSITPDGVSAPFVGSVLADAARLTPPLVRRYRRGGVLHWELTEAGCTFTETEGIVSADRETA